MSTILAIVHPSATERRRLAAALEGAPLSPRRYATVRACLPDLGRASQGLVIVPAHLPEPGTRQFIETLRVQNPSVSVVVIGSEGDVPTAVSLIQAGALAFLASPHLRRRLVALARQILPAVRREARGSTEDGQVPAPIARVRGGPRR